MPLTGTWRRSSAKAVLKLLALSPGHRAARSQILGALWPDDDPTAAGRNLRAALHAARQFVAGPGLLVWDREFLTLRHARVDVSDVVTEARAALRRADRAAMATALAELAPELLPEDGYTDWLVPHRSALAALRSELAGALEALPAGRWIPWALRGLAQSPLRGRERVLSAVVAPERLVTVISGEAGLGKTRLVAEAAGRAAQSGAAVLWGTAHEAEGHAPYGPFTDAIGEYLASLSQGE